jgi:hypothetical protein
MDEDEDSLVCFECGKKVEEVDENGLCVMCSDVAAGDCICSHCNGSGEGMHDGSTCSECGGSGNSARPYGRRRTREREPDDDDRDDDRAIERAEAAYERRIYG